MRSGLIYEYDKRKYIFIYNLMTFNLNSNLFFYITQVFLNI